MDTDVFIGMFLWEAREILHKAGIDRLDVMVTAPPRHTDRIPNDSDRILMVDPNHQPLRLLVCKT